ncbi:MAG: aspartate carbamoyltransferase catalytic subunit [Firmicutes bacterium]|nr:aspartate carbamoyltransferase catalytic subunit [Bacillota bacterium]
MHFSRRCLLGLEDLTAEEIEEILQTAVPCKEIIQREVKKLPTLRGWTVATLFYEPSTRTRNSFELAAKWLGADTVNVTVATSSVQKGENFIDTAKTIEALGADFIILRHSMAGAPWLLARTVDCRIINAGDGAHEHPTQALLDLFTLKEKFSSLAGLKVVIVGDIMHSRVAKSDIYGLLKLGAKVRVTGPPSLIPPGIEELGVEVITDLREAVRDVDVINVLRIQLERQKKGLFPSLREYARLYGINREILKLAPEDAVIMHPGPANLGVEITEEAAVDPRSVITTQVTNGVAVRMALLYLMSGGGKSDELLS